MKTITQTTFFKAPPHELYEAILDPKKHAQFTLSKAANDRKVGGKFSAYDDYITGINLFLEPDKKIVQKWTSTDFPKGHYSEVTFDFKKNGTGTELVFTQTKVPDSQYAEISQGWEDFYWKPLRDMFGDKS
jgi:activator of HSP90 ATPase